MRWPQGVESASLKTIPVLNGVKICKDEPASIKLKQWVQADWAEEGAVEGYGNVEVHL